MKKLKTMKKLLLILLCVPLLFSCGSNENDNPNAVKFEEEKILLEADKLNKDGTDLTGLFEGILDNNKFIGKDNDSQKRVSMDELTYMVNGEISWMFYESEPFTGIGFQNYENGQLKVESIFKDGKENGLSKMYYENGQLLGFQNHKDGKPDGLWENHYEDGQLESSINYKDGKQDGLSKIYYKNGQLKVEGNYKNGKYNGLFNGYYENGHLIQQVNYMDGNIISTKCWDKEGNEIECK
jgi:antitoxin component YwqK of YwqJK toxin-antitoxin module